MTGAGPAACARIALSALFAVAGPAASFAAPPEAPDVEALAVAGEELVLELAVRRTAALPDGARVDERGRLVWTPAPAQAGEHRLALETASGGRVDLLVTVEPPAGTPGVHFGGCDCQKAPRPTGPGGDVASALLLGGGVWWRRRQAAGR